MHARKSQAIGFAAITTALVTLLITSLLCYQDWKGYEVAYAKVRRERRILNLNEALVERMRDAETGQRGYLLTGREDYLEPYRSASTQLESAMQELESLVKDDPTERSRFVELQQFIGDKMAELRKTIDLQKSGDHAAALGLVQTDQGKRTMDRIRRLAEETQAMETARWDAAWEDLRRGAERLRIVTALGALLFAALVTAGGLALRNAFEQRRRLVEELAVSKQTAEEARDLLRATLYSIGDGVITTGAQGAIQMMNAVAERMTGYAEAEVRGKNVEQVFRIVNEATRSSVENPIRRVLREGLIVGLANHTVLIPKTGPEIPIDDSAAPIMGLAGSTSGVVLVFRDVTERRRAAETARRLASIVENSDDAIIGKSLEGVVTAWNRGAERLFGYTAAEMIGTAISRLIPPDRANETEDILQRIRAGESIDHYETERITRDGRRIKVSLTISPIRDGEGEVIGASKIARDITRQRHLEEFVRQTQKMEAVGRLAGGLAHDFNNLLTVILGYAATLNQRLASDDPSRKTVSEILRAGERAASLTGQLLTFSRKQITQPRLLDLNALMGESRDMLQRLIGEDVNLAVAPDREPCLVKIDSGQITQILMNLAVNARDAMPTGGKLTIETHTVIREQEDLGRRGVRPSGRYVRLTVSDTGVGMDAETAQHLFEPFFTTKEAGKGTGLGLATVYGIVTQHSGWIDVYSEPGHGAVFQIYFPVAEGKPDEVAGRPEQALPSRAATILLVEDQAAIRMLAEDMLEAAGHKVLSAANGRLALELANRHAEAIDLVITDVVMPEMSGPELVEQLVRSRPGFLVLYISGYTDHALLHRGTIEQGTAFLQKPFLPEALAKKVAQILQEAASARGAPG